MGTIVLNGGPDHAPVYLPDSGISPSWSGKSIFELSRLDLEAITSFSTDDAYEMGKNDFIEDRPLTPNPFHPRFLLGVPHTAFETYYQRGQLLAAGSWSASLDYGLFGERAHGHQPAALPV